MQASNVVVGISFRADDHQVPVQSTGQTGGNFGIEQERMKDLDVQVSCETGDTRYDADIEFQILRNHVKAFVIAKVFAQRCVIRQTTDVGDVTLGVQSIGKLHNLALGAPILEIADQ